MDDFVRTKIDNQVFLPMVLYVRARAPLIIIIIIIIIMIIIIS